MKLDPEVGSIPLAQFSVLLEESTYINLDCCYLVAMAGLLLLEPSLELCSTTVHGPNRDN